MDDDAVKFCYQKKTKKEALNRSWNFYFSFSQHVFSSHFWRLIFPWSIIRKRNGKSWNNNNSLLTKVDLPYTPHMYMYSFLIFALLFTMFWSGLFVCIHCSSKVAFISVKAGNSHYVRVAYLHFFVAWWRRTYANCWRWKLLPPLVRCVIVS